MQKITDFNLTEQEIRKIFSSQEDYAFFLAWYAQHPGSNSEKVKIARMLFIRGKLEESRELLETIEDERLRQDCLLEYASWDAPEGVIVN